MSDTLQEQEDRTIDYKGNHEAHLKRGIPTVETKGGTEYVYCVTQCIHEHGGPHCGYRLRKQDGEAPEDRKERYLLKADHQTEWDEVTKEQFITAEQAAGFHSRFGPKHLATGGFSDDGIRGRIEYMNQQPPSNPGWCSECQGYPPHMPWCAKSTTSSTSSGNQLKTTAHELAARGGGDKPELIDQLLDAAIYADDIDRRVTARVRVKKMHHSLRQ